MGETNAIVAIVAGVIALGYLGYKLGQKRKRLKGILNVLGARDAAMCQALERIAGYPGSAGVKA